MAGKKRRYQWIDAIDLAQTSIAAGAISDQGLLTEAELENVGGGATLERIVGSIIVTAGAATRGQMAMGIFLLEQYAGASIPTVAAMAANDTYQRKDCLWTGIAITAADGDFSFAVPRVHHLDWRSRRKLGQGVRCTLLTTATSSAMRVSFHLRFLLALP